MLTTLCLHPGPISLLAPVQGPTPILGINPEWVIVSSGMGMGLRLALGDGPLLLFPGVLDSDTKRCPKL